MKSFFICLVLILGWNLQVSACDWSQQTLKLRRMHLVKRTWDSIKSEVTYEKMARLYDKDVELVDFHYSNKGLQNLVAYWEATRSPNELAYVRYDSAEMAGDILFVRWTIFIKTKATATAPSLRLASPGFSEIRFRPHSLIAYFERDYVDPLKPVPASPGF